MIWAGLLAAGLQYYGLFTWPKVTFLISGHFLIDRWKARKVVVTRKDLMVDQCLHMIQILITVVT
jgi:hypothetical protein